MKSLDERVAGVTNGVLMIAVALGVAVTASATSVRSGEGSVETGRLDRIRGSGRSPRPRLYRRSSRWQHLATGSEPPPSDGVEDDEGFIYVRVPCSPQPRWQTRALALAGLMLLVSATALTVTLGVFQLGRAVNHIAQGFMAH